MPVVMYCPFLTVDYKSKNGRLRIKCEKAVVDFHDDAERKNYICRYCGSLSGWKKCTIAQSAIEYYDRKEM